METAAVTPDAGPGPPHHHPAPSALIRTICCWLALFTWAMGSSLLVIKEKPLSPESQDLLAAAGV